MAIYNGTPGNDTYLGTAQNDTINGGDGDDRLDGAAGADVITGGEGNDNLSGMDGNDSVSGGSGHDTLRGDSYDTASNLGGIDTISGGDGNDQIITGWYDSVHGDGGDDWVFAGGNLYGDGGNDTLISFGSGDWQTTVAGGDGNDKIDVQYYVSNGSVRLDGGAGDDTLTGGEGGEVILGGSGNDRLDGWYGFDTLQGGAGNDSYILSFGAQVSEVDDAGIDEIYINGNFNNVANPYFLVPDFVENVTVVTAGTIEGNALDNTITGYEHGSNVLIGGAGNDTLTDQGNWSYDGPDSLYGGTGDDVLLAYGGSNLVDGGDGYDTVDFTAWGTTYPLIVDLANVNHDTSPSPLGHNTFVSVEAVFGSRWNDSLYGDDGANYLIGGAGSDRLEGRGGIDTLAGGLGDDIYYIDTQADVIHEASDEGSDTIFTTVAVNVTEVSIEHVYVTSGAGTEIMGNVLNNLLAGYTGDDTLHGADGNDTLAGGDGHDVVDAGAGNDWLAGDSGGDSMIGGLGDDTFYVDHVDDHVVENDLEGTDSVVSSISYSLGQAVEILTLTGTGHLTGTGNSLNNTLYGNASGNLLDGSEGSDLMNGGRGDDTYVVDAAGDSVVEGSNQGIDLVLSSRSWALGADLENLTLTGTANIDATGNTYANLLMGNIGNNSLAGGQGDDTYVIQNAGDKVVEAHYAGYDTIYASVSYSLLGRAVEAFIMTGTEHLTVTGNSLANLLTGNSGNNLLDGGVGADVMTGGLGNDTYYVDHVQDRVVELHLQGTDTVFSSVSYSLLGRAVEILTLTGAGNLNGTGNSLANTITGTKGNNVLDGGAGADKLVGGLGDDTYYVDNAGDNVQEQHLQGTDTVFSSVTYSLLGRAVENMTLTGGGNINATGNSINNGLIGNSGSNRLDGGVGSDTLTGGLGSDIFLFGAASGKDTVTDFSAAQNDMININAYTGGVANAAIVSQAGANTIIALGGGNTVTVLNASSGDVLTHIIW